MTNKTVKQHLCASCGNKLQMHQYPDGEIETINEAYLTIGGGYCSFVDDITHSREGDPYKFVICEACAVKLCRTLGLDAPLREHHTSTVCECPDRPARDERGFPLPCKCEVCAR